MTERKARSPYQRHQKAPFQYSTEYTAWRRNPCAATNEAWHARWGFYDRSAGTVQRPPRRQAFPAGVAPFVGARVLQAAE